MTAENKIKTTLEAAVKRVRGNQSGEVACYIPELAKAPAEFVSIALKLTKGTYLAAGDDDQRLFSLQSTAKLVLLIGLLEEFGSEQVFQWVKVEPSGNDFSSVARLDQFGPIPSNPMLNAGAIALSGHIPGQDQDIKLAWLERWVAKLFGRDLQVNQAILKSEYETGDRNRSLAYLMKSNGVIQDSVEAVLKCYFYLCSFEASVQDCTYLAHLLANHGCNERGERLVSKKTVQQVSAIMATCGLYNESGTHLVRTGMPAKSGVSGLILAVVPDRAGIVVCSPRINNKGTSIRGEEMLAYVAEQLDWHFYA